MVQIHGPSIGIPLKPMTDIVNSSVRMVNRTGFETQTISRSYTIDNVPPAPSLRFQGDVEVFDQKLPAESAYAGSLLEVNFDVYNAGDKDATDIYVRLTAPGEESEAYPSQGVIPSLGKRRIRGCNPVLAG